MREEDYKKLINERKEWYKTLGKIYCPALKIDVLFNAKGFNHILHNGSGFKRNTADIFHRLMVLHEIVPILKSIQDINNYRLDGNVQYWSFEKLNNDETKVVVIVRKIGNGSVHFYSVWKRK